MPGNDEAVLYWLTVGCEVDSVCFVVFLTSPTQGTKKHNI